MKPSNRSEIPNPNHYVLLADTVYTVKENPQNPVNGVQCILFCRRNDGASSFFPRAIALRHNGEANVGYADGHVGTTADRIAMRVQSLIGAYADPSGQNFYITR